MLTKDLPKLTYNYDRARSSALTVAIDGAVYKLDPTLLRALLMYPGSNQNWQTKIAKTYVQFYTQEILLASHAQ